MQSPLKQAESNQTTGARDTSAAKEQRARVIVTNPEGLDLANGMAKAAMKTSSAGTGISHELRNAWPDRKA